MRSVLTTALLLGCHGPPPSFPDGLEPLEENLAEFPAGDDHPERLEIVSDSAPTHLWAHARGYVHAPLEETWAALQDPDVDVDRREVSEWTVEWDVRPEYEVSYRIHQKVVNIVTVEYDLEWWHGRLDDDETIAVRWDKTDGTSLIDALRGSIVLYPASDDVTAIEIVEHLSAPASTTERLETYLVDLHASVVASVDGEPLPTY